MDELGALLKSQRRRLLAHLTRTLGLGHLALAEDAVQVASLRALEQWPQQGWPANPAGWLYRVAHHHAIDVLRAAGRLQALPDDDGGEAGPGWPVCEPVAGRLQGELDDDELALLFAACHPRLPAATQVALALRALCGLDLAAIAEGLFSSEAALAQRLARARATLAEEALEIPAGAALPPRLDSVMTALLLMFHHGQQAAGRQGDPRPYPATPAAGLGLCWEAIRLARALAGHRATAHADADAAAALLLLHGARLSGRFDERGHIVPLPGQPRDRWDTGLIRLGLAHLQAAQRADRLSRWHLMAGIAAEHALAPDHAGTDWPAIVRYYGLLTQLDPSAAPALGHAIALAEAGAADEALARLQALEPRVPQALRAHTLAAMARAHERLGRRPDALHCLDAAIAQARHAADARLLAHHRQRVAAGGKDSG